MATNDSGAVNIPRPACNKNTAYKFTSSTHLIHAAKKFNHVLDGCETVYFTDPFHSTTMV